MWEMKVEQEPKSPFDFEKSHGNRNVNLFAICCSNNVV